MLPEIILFLFRFYRVYTCMVFWCLAEKILEIEYRHGIEVLYRVHVGMSAGQERN